MQLRAYHGLSLLKCIYVFFFFFATPCGVGIDNTVFAPNVSLFQPSGTNTKRFPGHLPVSMCPNLLTRWDVGWGRGGLLCLARLEFGDGWGLAGWPGAFSGDWPGKQSACGRGLGLEKGLHAALNTSGSKPIFRTTPAAVACWPPSTNLSVALTKQARRRDLNRGTVQNRGQRATA